MKKGKDYNDVNAYGEFRALPAGGYVCKVLGAKEQKNRNGGDMLVVMLDIAEGEYRDYFIDLYDARKKKSNDPKSVKYPNDGIAYINVEDNEGNTNRKFKAFCTSIEESGGEVWDAEDTLMTDDLKGAYIGVIFRREQHEYNGKMYWNTKPFAFRGIDTIQEGNYTVPDDLYAEPSNDSYGMPLPESFAQAEMDIPF